ncbi:hypothetical protein PM082_021322 [Marasmius tenuissimus]|nr:hypothetical protein PM082_021322 [Marasmius tenuissimus]
MCLVECLHFIVNQLNMDAYLGIPVVDGGLLLHLCKLKHVIADHPFLSPDREQKHTTMLRASFFHTTNLLLMLARYSMHRPVAVRVLRSMQKIESLGLDSWDSVDDGGRGYFKQIQATWQSLKHEATQRVSEGDIYWSADAKEFCANANASTSPLWMYIRPGSEPHDNSVPIHRFMEFAPFSVVPDARAQFTARMNVKKRTGN